MRNSHELHAIYARVDAALHTSDTVLSKPGSNLKLKFPDFDKKFPWQVTKFLDFPWPWKKISWTFSWPVATLLKISNFSEFVSTYFLFPCGTVDITGSKAHSIFLARLYPVSANKNNNMNNLKKSYSSY